MMEQPKEITLRNLEVLVMPNGEVICLGKSIGWFYELANCLLPQLTQAEEELADNARREARNGASR